MSHEVIALIRRKCKSLVRIAATVLVACGHRLLDLLGLGKNGANLHAASQTMIISSTLRQLDGMTTMSERAYLYWYAKCIYGGKGSIVDLGCWLGSTTIAMAMGLGGNHRLADNRLIYSYDEFIWRSYMDSRAKGTVLEGKYSPGDSFLDEFERRVSPWRQYVKPCPGDLAKVGWCGAPIEFLLIDAMKSWAAATGVVQKFFPALMPGVSLILHQDFAHWFTAWIHPIHYRFRQYFEPVYDVPSSGSMVFQLAREIPPELMQQEWSPGQFSDQEVDAAFAYSLDIVRPEKRANIVAAKAMYFVYSTKLDRAKQEIEDAHARGYHFDSDLAFAARRIDEELARLSGSGAK